MSLEYNFPLHPHHTSEGLAGVHLATEVKCIQPGSQNPQPEQYLQEQMALMVEEELEMVQA